MKKIWIKAALSACLAWTALSHAELPRVEAQPDASRSFWKEQVHYPYPVQMAKVTDARQRSWEIGYLDVYRGDASQRDRAPVLVLLHGRGMTSAYWGPLLEQPLAQGMRVIAIDLPHYGKSLPGNLQLPVNRSLQDIRDVVHQLVVKQLGVKKASYLGHSLGGQVVLGYVLQHPDNVDKAVLYGTAGLESAGPIWVKGVRIDDPALAQDYDTFRAAWDKAGILPGIGSNRDDIEKFFYVPLRPGARPYLSKGQPLSDYIVATRVGLLQAPAEEARRYGEVFGWEMYATLHEMRQEDPQALPFRLKELKVPVFVAYGQQESAVPLPFSGNGGLVDVVDTVYRNTKRNPQPVTIKLYDKAGHFLHLDQPDTFASDVVAFLRSGKVAGKLYTGDAESYQPVAMAAANLPGELLAFKQEAETVFNSKDMARVKTAFHPEFKSNGRTLDQQMSWLSGVVPMFSRWELAVINHHTEGELLNMEVEYRTSIGNFPEQVTLKRHDGKWKFYGNQK